MFFLFFLSGERFEYFCFQPFGEQVRPLRNQQITHENLMKREAPAAAASPWITSDPQTQPEMVGGSVASLFPEVWESHWLDVASQAKLQVLERLGINENYWSEPTWSPGHHRAELGLW